MACASAHIMEASVRLTSSRILATAAAVALTVGIGSAIAAEGEPDAVEAADELVVGAADEELVERLLVIEADLPAPLPSSAELAADGVDALLTGSFTSARSTFDSMEDQLRDLFVDADDATTEIGEAVASVAHGLLLERQGLLVLEETDQSDETRPLDVSDARDDDGNAIDADGYHGRQTTALRILLESRELQRAGYAVLRELPKGVDENGVLAARWVQLVDYRDGTEVQLRQVAATESEQLLVEVARYDAPLGVAQSLGVAYVCVDRVAYELLAEAPESERIAASITLPDEDCSETARLAGLPLSEQVAVDELLDGVETAVGTG